MKEVKMMPGVEGFTPAVAWTTIYGIIALCILFMVVYKVYDAIRNEVERKRRDQERTDPDLADKVSKKVIDTLEPRFQEIERNISRDKIRIDNHELLFSDVKEAQRKTREGLSAICKTLLVIITHGNVGTSEKVQEATEDLTRYLAERL